MILPTPFIATILATSSIALVGIGIYSINGAKQIRARRRAELEKATYRLLTACAGSQGADTPQYGTSINPQFNTFRTKNGAIIDPEDYLQFIVKGNSMRYYGIHDGDIIFVKKDFDPEDLTNIILPKAIVLKRRIVSVGESEYKVRRAWAVCDIEQCRKMIDTVINSKAFDVIKKIKDESDNLLFNSDAAIVDFENERLPIYCTKFIDCDNPQEGNRKVVLSTTYDTKKKKIHFSIHPISMVVGIVSESYTINKTNS